MPVARFRRPFGDYYLMYSSVGKGEMGDHEVTDVGVKQYTVDRL